MEDILKVEVMLSNFAGRDRVSLSEFIGYAAMSIEENAYRKGIDDANKGRPDISPELIGRAILPAKTKV